MPAFRLREPPPSSPELVPIWSLEPALEPTYHCEPCGQGHDKPRGGVVCLHCRRDFSGSETCALTQGDVCEGCAIFQCSDCSDAAACAECALYYCTSCKPPDARLCLECGPPCKSCDLCGEESDDFVGCHVCGKIICSDCPGFKCESCIDAFCEECITDVEVCLPCRDEDRDVCAECCSQHEPNEEDSDGGDILPTGIAAT